MEKTIEQALLEAMREGDEKEYAIFEPALYNLLQYRALQSDVPARKMKRRVEKCDPKRRR